MSYNSTKFRELLVNRLVKKNLTKEELENIKEEALEINDDFMTCRILVTITEYPQASIELIQEIKDHIFAIIKDNKIRETYREEMEETSIVRQLYIKLNNKTLKENELRKMIEMTLTIKNDYKKGEILIDIARRSETSLELTQEIKEHISSKIKDEDIRTKRLELIDKILEDKSITYKIGEKLKDKTLTEDKLREIIETTLTIETNSEKYKSLVSVAEHPQASQNLIVQEIKEYVAKINDGYYLNSYIDKTMEIWLNRLKDKTLTEKELGQITQDSWKVVEKYRAKQDIFLENVVITLVEHPQTSLKFLQNIEHAISGYFYRNAYKGIFDKIDARKSEIKKQQSLEQYKGALGEFSALKKDTTLNK